MKANANTLLVVGGLALLGIGTLVVASAAMGTDDDGDVKAVVRAYPASAPVAARLVALARTLGARPAWIANVIQFESRWNPQAINQRVEVQTPGTGASGLVQFTTGTAAQLGTSLAKIRAMGMVEQFELVEQYFLLARIPKPLATQADVFMAVFYPRAIGRGPDWLLGSDRGLEYVAKLQADNPGIKTAADYTRKALASARMA